MTVLFIVLRLHCTKHYTKCNVRLTHTDKTPLAFMTLLLPGKLGKPVIYNDNIYTVKGHFRLYICLDNQY